MSFKLTPPLETIAVSMPAEAVMSNRHAFKKDIIFARSSTIMVAALVSFFIFRIFKASPANLKGSRAFIMLRIFFLGAAFISLNMRVSSCSLLRAGFKSI